jgi:hypothetical protein
VAAGHTLALSKKGGDLTASFEARLALALVLTQSGKAAEATKTLSALRDDVSQNHYLNYELQVRLMLGGWNCDLTRLRTDEPPTLS